MGERGVGVGVCSFQGWVSKYPGTWLVGWNASRGIWCRETVLGERERGSVFILFFPCLLQGLSSSILQRPSDTSEIQPGCPPSIYMSSSYGHPLPLKETSLLRYLPGLAAPGCAALSAGGTRVIDMLPNWPAGSGPTSPTVIHAFQQETLVVTTPATSSLGSWASGGHSILSLQELPWKHARVHCVHAVTHRWDHRDHRGHKTISAVIQHRRTAEGQDQTDRAQVTSRNQGQRLSLVSPCRLALQPVPVRENAALASTINAICMHAWFFPRRSHLRPVVCRCFPAFQMLWNCDWSGSIRSDIFW